MAFSFPSHFSEDAEIVVPVRNLYDEGMSSRRSSKDLVYRCLSKAHGNNAGICHETWTLENGLPHASFAAFFIHIKSCLSTPTTDIAHTSCKFIRLMLRITTEEFYIFVNYRDAWAFSKTRKNHGRAM